MSFSSDDVDPSIASFFDETESVPSMGSETSSAFSMMSGSNQKDFSEFVAEKTSGKNQYPKMLGCVPEVDLSI